MNVVLFVRVSTTAQSYDRQVSDLTRIAGQNRWTIVRIIHETGSATKRRNIDRPELNTLIDLCKTGDIQKVLVTEFSRLGRQRGETVRLLETLTGMGVSVYAKNLGMETLLESGKRNPVAGIVMAVMTEIDAMETERLSERILSGQDEARKKGKKIGRPQGATAGHVILEKYPLVVKDLKSGKSVRSVAAIRGVAASTVQRIKKLLTE